MKIKKDTSNQKPINYYKAYGNKLTTRDGRLKNNKIIEICKDNIEGGKSRKLLIMNHGGEKLNLPGYHDQWNNKGHILYPKTT